MKAWARIETLNQIKLFVLLNTLQSIYNALPLVLPVSILEHLQ